MTEPRDDDARQAPAPQLGPSTDVTLGDATMELLAYGDLAGAKARHDGTHHDGRQEQPTLPDDGQRAVPPTDTMQD